MRDPQPRPSTFLSGHVVVCGVLGTGLRMVEQLRAVGTSVVVVDDHHDGARDAVAEQLLGTWDVPRVVGRGDQALLDAGIHTAKAVVCVYDDDLRDLAAALAARRLRPDVRVVVRLANPAVGRALAEVMGPRSVLDVAELAAPSIVAACLGDPVQRLDIGGREFAVVEKVAPRAAPLRSLYGERLPLAVVSRTPGAPKVVCPSRDHAASTGDTVTLIGPADEILPPTAHQRARHPAGARHAGAAKGAFRTGIGDTQAIGRVLRALVAEADRRLRYTLAALLTVVAVSVVVLQLGYRKTDGSGMSTLDAVYFTVETIATVGYGDFNFSEQTEWLRAFAVGLMITGTILAAVLFALVTQLLVSSRLEKSFGQTRVGGKRDHVIVVGLGAVGLQVVERLVADGIRVVVVEQDEANRHLAHARALSVPVLTGDGTDADVLAAANLVHARAVAVLTSDDLVNIEAALAVRDQLGDRVGTTPVVLRVFDRVLADSLATLGFRDVYSDSELAAPVFVGAALGLDVLATCTVAGEPFVLGGIAVTAGGPLDGLATGELAARTRVVALHRAAIGGVRTLEHPPRRNTRFARGDVVYLMGPYEEMLLEMLRDTTQEESPGDAGSSAAGH